jgi:hypothetical protein
MAWKASKYGTLVIGPEHHGKSFMVNQLWGDQRTGPAKERPEGHDSFVGLSCFMDQYHIIVESHTLRFRDALELFKDLSCPLQSVVFVVTGQITREILDLLKDFSSLLVDPYCPLKLHVVRNKSLCVPKDNSSVLQQLAEALRDTSLAQAHLSIAHIPYQKN